MRRFTVILVVGLLAGCSSGRDSSSGEGRKYVHAALTNYDRALRSRQTVLTRSDARCLAEGVVDAVGIEVLRRANVTPHDFARDSSPFAALRGTMNARQARTLTALVTDGRCFDFAAVAAAQAEGAPSFSKFTRPQVQCFFRQVVADTTVRRALAKSMLGQSTPGSNPLESIATNRSKLVRILDRCHLKLSQLQS